MIRFKKPLYIIDSKLSKCLAPLLTLITRACTTLPMGRPVPHHEESHAALHIDDERKHQMLEWAEWAKCRGKTWAVLLLCTVWRSAVSQLWIGTSRKGAQESYFKAGVAHTKTITVPSNPNLFVPDHMSNSTRIRRFHPPQFTISTC